MRRLFGFSKKSQKGDGGELSSPAAPAGGSPTGEALPSPQLGGPLSFSNPLENPQESFRELGTHQQPHVNREQQQGSNNSKKSQGQQRQVAFAGATTTDTESSHPLRPAYSLDSYHPEPQSAFAASARPGSRSGQAEAGLPSPPLSKGRMVHDLHQQGPRIHTPQQHSDVNSRSMSPLSASSHVSAAQNNNNHQLSLFQTLSGGRANVNASSTQITAPTTWAELADPDLVENLGSRERTRQEVLWEIVASEERYVQELISLVECYITPLLYPTGVKPSPTPSTGSSTLPSPPLDGDAFNPFQSSSQPRYRQPAPAPATSGFTHRNSSQSMGASSDTLPIAARFARTMASSQDSGGALPSTTSTKGGRNYGRTSLSSEHSQQGAVGLGIDSVPTMDEDTSARAEEQRSRRKADWAHSRPPTSQSGRHQSTTSLKQQQQQQQQPPSGKENHGAKPTNIFRHHLKNLGPPAHNKLHRSDKAVPASEREAPKLPEHLSILLSIISDHLVGRHEQLSTLLKERWTAQYPLVRSLSDIWMDQTWMIHDYSIYVLHLEKSLQLIDEALASVHPKAKTKNTESEKELRKLAKLIIKLEERASAQGEGGLAISLSKPFQRLLKYPLLFQNLLYHTDASTAEFEGTQHLAQEIDRIVKSIESEKVSEEERDRLRDLWARIDSVNDKTLMVPRQERFLLEEFPVWGMTEESRSISDAGKHGKLLGVPESDHASTHSKSKKTVRRFSDMVQSSDKGKKPPSVGSKKDVWIIRLSDVVLKCQRVGVTTRPLGATLAKDSKGRKHSGPKRNMYRFIGVERWEPQLSLAHAETEEEAADQVSQYEEDEEQASAGGPSRMSFSYADDEPRPVLAPLPNGTRTFHDSQEAASPKDATLKNSVQNGDSKFGHRLRAGGVGTPALRSPTPGGGGPRRRAYEAPTAAYLNKVRPNTPTPAGDLLTSVRPNKPLPSGPPPVQQLPKSTTSGSLAQSSSTAALYATYAGFVDDIK